MSDVTRVLPDPKRLIVSVGFVDTNQQALQICLPANRWLDLNRLKRLAGGDLKPQPLQGDYLNFASVDLLNVRDVASWVDSELMEHSTVQVASGAGLLEVPPQQLFEALPSHRVLSLSQALSSLEPNAPQDLGQKVSTLTGRRVSQRLSEMLDMPPLSHSATKILKLRFEPDAGTDDLVPVVESDPSLAAQVVSWANSPYYSPPGSIENVHDAIIRVLGFDVVVNLALGMALGSTIRPPNSKRGQRYWPDSVLTAVTMEALARQMKPMKRPNLGLCYLTGLLHDFGFLVLSHLLGPNFASIEAHYDANPHLPEAYLDRSLLGMTRSELSAELLEQWNLPEPLVLALRHKHEPGDHVALVQLLSLTRHLLVNRHSAFVAASGRKVTELEALGLTAAAAQTAIRNTLAQMQDINDIAANLNQ